MSTVAGMECTCKKISLNELQKNQNEVYDTCTLPNHRIYSNHGKDEDDMNVGHANPINTKSDERFIVQPCKVISELNLCQRGQPDCNLNLNVFYWWKIVTINSNLNVLDRKYRLHPIMTPRLSIL